MMTRNEALDLLEVVVLIADALNREDEFDWDGDFDEDATPQVVIEYLNDADEDLFDLEDEFTDLDEW